MKYTIQSVEHFDDYDKANLAFEDIKKHKDEFINFNVGLDNEEKTLIKLIECDHDLPEPERTGSVVLKTLDIIEEKILEPAKIIDLIKK